MKKNTNILLGIAIAAAIMLFYTAVTSAANLFPTSLNTWVAGDIISEDWANALEIKIGADSSATSTSLDYLIKNSSSVDPGHLHSSSGISGTLTVAVGGTGATSLTDGGVLLGSGTGAITAMSVLANGELIVGDGTTDPVAESGATLRTSIGVSIGSDVQAWDAFLDDVAALTDPGADRILFWDDTAGDVVWLVPNTGISITGTNLNVGGLTTSEFATTSISQWANDSSYVTSTATETNTLETTITGILDTEFFVGNGADSGTFVVASGDLTLANTGAFTIIDDIIVAANFADEDWGDLSVLTNSLTLDASVVSDNEIDYGTVTLSDFTIDAAVYNFGAVTSLEIPNGAGGTTVDVTGEITIDSTSGTLNFYDGAVEQVLDPERCDIDFVIESPNATEDDYMRVFKATSTITRVSAVGKGALDSVTWNLAWETSRTQSTSTSRQLWSAYQVTTATTTATSTTSGFASTTVDSGMTLRFVTTAASSSQFGVTVCYEQNP